MSLRAELVGATESSPGFAVLLPEGWEGMDASADGIRNRLSDAVNRLPPAAHARARARMEELIDAARAGGDAGAAGAGVGAGGAEAGGADVARVFAPIAAGADTLPVTLVASWLTAPAPATAADLGADLIQRRGAVPLDPAQTILTWSLDQSTTLEGGRVDIAGRGYLLRVPGRATQALVFRSTILRGADGSTISDEGIEAMSAVCDAIVASVRWRRDG